MAYVNADIDISFDDISGVTHGDIEDLLTYHIDMFTVEDVRTIAERNDMQLLAIEEKDDMDKMAKLIKNLTGLAQIYEEMTIASMVNHFTSMTTLLDNYNLED